MRDKEELIMKVSSHENTIQILLDTRDSASVGSEDDRMTRAYIDALCRERDAARQVVRRTEEQMNAMRVDFQALEAEIARYG